MDWQGKTKQIVQNRIQKKHKLKNNKEVQS